MVHTRETRASACEIKFVIDLALAARVRGWARAHLLADPHGSGPFVDEYDTSSLYFDTPRFDVFNRRGSYGRAKYRVRRDGEADTVFLERKLRQPGLLIKRRTRASLHALAQLDQDGPIDTSAGEWFHRRLLARAGECRPRSAGRTERLDQAPALEAAGGASPSRPLYLPRA